MDPLIYPLVAFTPGIFWLWFFARRSVYRPGPRRLLVFTFLLGMGSTAPAAALEYIFLDDSWMSDSVELASLAAGMLFVVGPVEEVCKFLAVRLLAYRSAFFDEPGDGLAYSAAASLGFASLENLYYVMEFGPAVMLLRAPLSTVAHVIFGSFWGYALGVQVRSGQRRGWQTMASIAMGAVAHGLFNVAVFVSFPAAVALVAFGTAWTLGRFAWARRSSPFRYRRNYPLMACGNCNRHIRIFSRFCPFCGTPVSRTRGSIYCGFCATANRPDARYCSNCGDGLLR